MFEKLFNLIDTIILSNISSMVGIFTDTITPLIGACVVLYAIYLAYQALYDAENMMIMESMKFIGSLALCTTLAFSTSWYLDRIVPIILHSGDNIASELLNSNGTNAVQSMFDGISANLKHIWRGANIDFWEGDTWIAFALSLLICILILLGGLPFLGIATAYLIVAKVMVGFLLILGPLFIMFAFFPSTRSMFQSWTGQCLNYVLLSIVYPIAFGMFDATLNVLIPENGIKLSGVMMTFILFFVFIVLSVQIPTFTSSLSGGVGINGLVNNIGAGARTAGSIAKGTGKYTGATKLGSWLGGKAKDGAKNTYDKARTTIKPG